MVADKFADEMLTDGELDGVAGGTVAEFNDLCSAMANNPFVKKILEASAHMPVGNVINKEVVKYFLKENLNIEVDISIGFLGMGIGSYHNTYKDLTEIRQCKYQSRKRKKALRHMSEGFFVDVNKKADVRRRPRKNFILPLPICAVESLRGIP